MKKVLLKVLRWAVLILGVLVTANAVFMTFVSNRTLGVYLTYALGLMFLAVGIFYKFVCLKLPKVILWIFIGGLIFVFGFVSFLYAYGMTDNVSYKEDAVIVLGAGIHGENVSLTLKNRLDKAVEYHGKNPDALIVVSGGQGYQEDISEALAMERYLVGAGVEPSVIIKEDRSTSTAENFKFSKNILDKRFDREYKCVYITNDFHILRAGFVSRQQGFSKMSHIHSGAPFYTVLPNGMREVLAVMKYLVFG